MAVLFNQCTSVHLGVAGATSGRQGSGLQDAWYSVEQPFRNPKLRLDAEMTLQKPSDDTSAVIPCLDAKLLSSLPHCVLDRVLHGIRDCQAGRLSVRATCSWLRKAFDSGNCRLALGGGDAGLHRHQPPGLPALLLELVRRTPHLRVVVLRGWLQGVSLAELLTASPKPEQICRIELGGLGWSRCCVSMSDLQALSACTALQHLDLSSCKLPPDVAPLAKCTALQHLNLNSCGKVDLAPLAACTALQRLLLCGNFVSDLSPLTACISLQQLDLSGTPVSGLEPLAACSALHHLDLEGCFKVSDVTPLAACTALQHLNLGGCNISFLGPLEACTALQHLCLRDCVNVSVLAALEACLALQQLDLTRCRHISDLAPLSACAALQHLCLLGCRNVSDLAPLAACKALQHLDIRRCSQVADLAPLTGHPALTITQH